MPHNVDHDTVAHVATLARLRLEDHEVAGLARDLQQILAYVARLDALDLQSVAPFTHGAHDAAMPLRPDVPQRNVEPQVLQALAPDPADGFFRVPHVLGDE